MSHHTEFHFHGDVTIHDFRGISHCTIYTTSQPASSDSSADAGSPLPNPPEQRVEEATAVEPAALEAYLTVGYRDKRRREWQQAWAVITDSQWSDKDRARMAWLLYCSEHLLPIRRPHTFKSWYRLFCSLLHFRYIASIKPCQLTENEATRALRMYL